MLFRFDRGLASIPAGFMDGIADFLNAYTANRYTDFAILSCKWAPGGQTYMLPIAAPSGIATGTAAITTGSNQPAYLRHEGLTTGGNPWSVTLYGSDFRAVTESGNSLADYVLTSVESAVIANAVIALLGIPGLCGADSGSVLPYDYVNVGYNAHWEKRARNS